MQLLSLLNAKTLYNTRIESGDGEDGEAVGGVDKDDGGLHVHHFQQEQLLQPSVKPGAALNLKYSQLINLREMRNSLKYQLTNL